MTQVAFTEHFHRAVARFGLTRMDLEHHGIRQGGTRHDIVEGHRSLLEVQKRLRHTSLVTACRYEKSGKLGQQLRSALQEVVTFGSLVAQR